MSRMLVISSLPKEVGGRKEGGVAQVSWNLIKEFRRKNFEVDILPKLFDYSRSKEKNIIKINSSFKNTLIAFKLLLFNYYKFTLSPRNTFHLFRSLRMLLSVSRYEKYDLILLHHINNQISLAKKILGIQIPLYVVIHSHHHFAFLNKKQKRKQVININEQLQYVNGVIYVSGVLKKQGEKYGIIEHQNEIVIHNGINIHESITLIKSNRNDIVFIGSFISRKGIEVLVEVLKENPEFITKMNWIGEGQLESFIKRELSNKSFKNIFWGSVDHRKAMSILAESKALVVPSKMESFGLVYAEALSLGIPVVGYKEILKEFEKLICDKEENFKFRSYLQGFSHQEDDHQILKNKIDRCITEYDNSSFEFREELSQKINSQFSWKTISQEYLEYLYN